VLAVVGTPRATQAQSSQALRIVPLVRGEQVLVKFELRDGFTEEVRAAIKSGLKTTYTYNVVLRLSVPVGFDRMIGSTVITSSVDYDNLHRLFKLERRLDGRILETKETADENDVRDWMTTFGQHALFPTTSLEPNRDYYVRVSATARPTGSSIFWPFASGASGQTKFTFFR
jgi:uncharacterized protein DUF4390